MICLKLVSVKSYASSLVIINCCFPYHCYFQNCFPKQTISFNKFSGLPKPVLKPIILAPTILLKPNST